MFGFHPLSGPTTAAYDFVTHLATALGPVGGTATAIIVFTVLVRLLVHPLTRSAVRGERARLRLAPQLAQLRRKHRGDNATLAQEMTALHRREGISPLAGMLPMLVQAPFFLVTYSIFARSSVGQHVNTLMSHTLFGLPLGARFTGAAGLGGPVWVFLGLFAVLGGLAWLSSRRAARLTAVNAPVVALAGGGTTRAGDAEQAVNGFMARLPRILPYLTVVTAAFLPLAAGLYLLTSTAWTLAENALLRRGLPERG